MKKILFIGIIALLIGGCTDNMEDIKVENNNGTAKPYDEYRSDVPLKD